MSYLAFISANIKRAKNLRSQFSLCKKLEIRLWKAEIYNHGHKNILLERHCKFMFKRVKRMLTVLKCLQECFRNIKYTSFCLAGLKVDMYIKVNTKVGLTKLRRKCWEIQVARKEIQPVVESNLIFKHTWARQQLITISMAICVMIVAHGLN